MAAMYGLHPNFLEDMDSMTTDELLSNCGYYESSDEAISESEHDKYTPSSEENDSSLGSEEEEEEKAAGGEEEEQQQEKIRKERVKKLTGLMERVRELYKSNFWVNSEMAYREFELKFWEYKKEKEKYLTSYYYDPNFDRYSDPDWRLHNDWDDEEHLIDPLTDHRFGLQVIGRDLSEGFDEAYERSRWFKSDMYKSTPEHDDDRKYECRRSSRNCKQIWCDLHMSEYCGSGKVCIYDDSDWAILRIDEVNDDPEHENRLHMFYSQDPGFNDEHLAAEGISRHAINPSFTWEAIMPDGTESDSDATFIGGEGYNPQPVISDDSNDSDSDVTYIDEGELSQG